VLTLTASQSPPPLPPRSIAKPAAASSAKITPAPRPAANRANDDQLDAMYQLAEDERTAEPSAAVGAGITLCPQCQAVMQPGEAVCVECGYDRRSGRATAAATSSTAGSGVVGRAFIPQYQRRADHGAEQGTSNYARTSMILGICSLVFFCFWKLALPAAIIAIVLGIMSRSQTSDGRGGRGMAIAGITCGSISLCISAVLIIGVLSLLHYGGPALQKFQQQVAQKVQQAQQDQAAGAIARDLPSYRAAHPTHLTRHGPPPEMWQDPTPLNRPPNVKEVTYPSGALQLKAWVSDIPHDGQLHPAVVFCHGGFWFGNDDWDALKPFLDAGFVVMAPRVRAENGNPGDFEYYYGEVDDVIAAGRFLAQQPGVDKQRLFVSGHSAGGDLSTLAAMLPNPFAMSAPIGASLDMRIMAKAKDERHRQLVVFDPADQAEVESRCAMLFTSSLRCPIALFHGDQDWAPELQTQFISLAHRFNKDATLTVVSGDHGESLPNSIPGIIKLFQAYTPSAHRGGGGLNGN
jgi:dienelactone hydrolase